MAAEAPAQSAAADPAAARAPLLERLTSAFFVVPGVAWLVLFFVVPLVLIFFVSLAQTDELDRIVFSPLTLENYQRALDPVFLPTFLNSLRYALITTILSLAIGYPIAYWISRYGGRHKALLLILRDNGVVNSLLGAVGLIDQPIILMNTDLSVILGMTYGFLPFAILPLFVSIDRLDQSLVAAARDLYASGRDAFLHVTLPITMPGIIAAALLTFIPAMGDFVTPDILGGAGTTTIARVIQDVFLESRDWAFGAALGFLLIVITLTGTVGALRILRREVIGT